MAFLHERGPAKQALSHKKIENSKIDRVGNFFFVFSVAKFEPLRKSENCGILSLKEVLIYARNILVRRNSDHHVL